MGNEGTKLGVMADKFMAANPDVKVSVTPVDWGQAVAKLQTAIGGGETPGREPDGHRHDGPVRRDGRPRDGAADIDPSGFFESAWQTNVVDGQAYGVPWYVETRVLYYRTDIAEKAGITAAPDDLGRAQGDGQGHAGRGWRRVRHRARNEERPGVPAVRLVERRRRHRRGRRASRSNSPQAVEALTFYDSFFEEGLTPKSVPEGFDITPAFVAGTHPMFFSGPWHVGLITEAGGADIEGKWAIAPMPKKTTGTSFVGGSNLVVFKDSPNKDAAWAFVKFMADPANQVAWYEEATVLPAVQSAWDDPAISR